MCGPIALALPYESTDRWSEVQAIVLYNLGRVTTYSIIGILPGLLGFGLSLAGYQKWVSFGLGLLFVLGALFSFRMKSGPFRMQFLDSFYQRITRQLGKLLSTQGRKTFFGIGVANGFLPCGLVYMALAGAITQSSVGGGAAYMAMFGFGTMPLMLLISFSKKRMGMRLRRALQMTTPLIILFFGFLLLYRSLMIDLPLNIDTWFLMGDPALCD